MEGSSTITARGPVSHRPCQIQQHNQHGKGRIHAQTIAEQLKNGSTAMTGINCLGSLLGRGRKLMYKGLHHHKRCTHLFHMSGQGLEDLFQR